MRVLANHWQNSGDTHRYWHNGEDVVGSSHGTVGKVVVSGLPHHITAGGRDSFAIGVPEAQEGAFAKDVHGVQVTVEVSSNFVVEGNCVVARRGGEQPETNHQSVGDELDSAFRRGEPALLWRSPTDARGNGVTGAAHEAAR
jgi:hypothetical protein